MISMHFIISEFIMSLLWELLHPPEKSPKKYLSHAKFGGVYFPPSTGSGFILTHARCNRARGLFLSRIWRVTTNPHPDQVNTSRSLTSAKRWVRLNRLRATAHLDRILARLFRRQSGKRRRSSPVQRAQSSTVEPSGGKVRRCLLQVAERALGPKF